MARVETKLLDGAPPGWHVWVAVGLGGMAGAISRWIIIGAVGESANIPWGPLLVNVLGSLCLGYLLGAHWPQRRVAAGTGLAIGFCGALTTFSTVAVELAAFLRDDRVGVAIVYLAASVTLGLAAAAAGHVYGRRTLEHGQS